MKTDKETGREAALALGSASRSRQEWEARARELIGEVVENHHLVGTGWQNREAWESACVAWALQLGREMAMDAACAARLEEIAIRKADVAQAADAEREKWQRAERELSDAYIRLRKLIPGAFDTLPGENVWSHTEACLRQLVGAADARAEEIAYRLDVLAYTASAQIARSTIRSAPKTREQVLEEALRKIAGQDDGRDALQPEYARSVARRALGYCEPPARVAPRPSDAGEWRP